MIKELINIFIIKYLIKNNAEIKDDGIIIRAFTEDYYNELIEEKKNAYWKSISILEDCICSNCGFELSFKQKQKYTPKYCPNCGRKMVKKYEILRGNNND